MKYFKIILSILAVAFLFSSCQDDDLGLDTIVVPTNLQVTTEISDDGSGEVSFQATANDALSYKYIYSDGTSAVSLGGDITKRFTSVGLNTYLVTVVAYGKGGVSSSKSLEVEVRSDFNDPETKQLLTGGSSKTWYIASAVPGHLGVGQNVNDEGPIVDGGGFFAGSPNFGPDCFYDDTMTFSLNANDDIVYEYQNFGVTFFNVGYTSQFGGNGEEDQCLDFTSPGAVPLSLVPASSGISSQLSTGTALNIANDGFVGYYIGQNQYEILSIDENKMVLRAVQRNNDFLAWYLILTTSADGTLVTDGGATDTDAYENTSSPFQSIFFEDEFEGTSLDTSVWNYEIGNGTNGWGNGEVQYYTDDEKNIKVQDGNLIITAIKEDLNGFAYTSGRINTMDKFEFTYGRVEIKAKLAGGGGTWPALWALGADFDVVGWPETGEIDIMEFVGNEPNRVQSAIHFPGNSGGNAIFEGVNIQNATSEFHIFEVEWTAEAITFLVDGTVNFTFANDENKPFDKDFFLIMNVAMGGALGGSIDSDFTESSMIIDYVKVFQ